MADQVNNTLGINSRAFFHIARDSRPKDASSQTLVTIVFSAIALESFVNEILERVRNPVGSREDQRITTLRTMSVAADLLGRSCSLETRVQVIYAALNGTPIDKGTQPYQDFALLVDLRNAVVHDRPERIRSTDSGGREGQPSSIACSLVARKVITAVDESAGVHPALNSIIEPAVDRFAFAAALAMARSLAGPIPWLRRALLLGFDKLDDPA